MNNEQIDSLFESAPEIPAALVDKIRVRIQSETVPVKPLMGNSFYVPLFMAIVALVAVTLAAALQFKALHRLSTGAAAELLLSLAIAAAFGAHIVARGMRPASGQLRSWLMGGLALLVYEALVIRLFNNDNTDGFVHSGIPCLLLGVLCGGCVAMPLWLIVRRGLVMQPVRTGAAIGLVGGLAGLTSLTLHCDILTVPHAGIWHAAVIVVCTTAGAYAAKVKS